MKNSVLISLTVAALSVAASPLALAQNAPLENDGSSYLSTRQNMDQPEAIARITAGVAAQQQTSGLDAAHQDYLASRENIDSPAHIQATYDQVAENRALEGSSLDQGHDYLSERERIDWPDHINALVGRTLEEVGQL